MKSRSLLSIILVALFLAGCANNQSGPSYEERLAQIPHPQNEDQRGKVCAYLRSEIARMQNLAAYGAAQMQPNMALYAQLASRNNIASIEAKAAEFRCSAAFAERQAPSGIEACVATCKANTSRTPEQCFNACNK
jgi:hypothetical protein